MTSIVILRADTGIVIASDGAAYDDDGRLRVLKQKVDLHPEISCVITSRGSPLAPYFVNDMLFWESKSFTFDQLVTQMPRLVRCAREFVAFRGSPNNQKFSIYLCGWSVDRERFETYGIRGYDTDIAPACTLFPLPAAYFAPEPPLVLADAFHVPLPPQGLAAWDWDTLAEYGTRAVCACRFGSGGDTGDEGQCCVGGFVQITKLMHGVIASEIWHRWPDPIGEVLDARRGNPSPWHLWPEDAERPAGFEA